MATATKSKSIKMIGFERRSGKRTSGIGPSRARALLEGFSSSAKLWEALKSIAAPEPTLVCKGVVEFTPDSE